MPRDVREGLCAQCSLEILNRNDMDFYGLCEEGDTIEVTCNYCGFTYVNHLGECLSPWCSLKHGLKRES